MKTVDPDIARSVDSDIVGGTTALKPDRLLSIDVLRGLTIAFMILVNNQVGPAPFSQLVHASWNGFTATDLVFPTFLLLVGLSTVLSIASRLSRGATRTELFLHTARRSAILILFGFIVNNFPFLHLATARYYGVLPRIAICYFVVATLYLISPGWKDKVIVALVCLIGYWALMRYVPVPGYGIPTRTVSINDHDGNLTAWLDRQIFSAPHLYERSRDPEGLLSTLPSISTALFGLLAGLWLRTARSPGRKVAMLAVAGALALCAGLAWSQSFPINKKLWTSSFVLFAGGWSLVSLSATACVVDLWRLGQPKPLGNQLSSTSHPLIYKPVLVFGTNAILAYMISELGDSIVTTVHVAGSSLKTVSYRVISTGIPLPAWSSLLYSSAFVLICWLLVLPFYRRRLFLRI
jgi:predicted acyltransferase